MNISYKRDSQFKYRNDIVKGLVTHNNSFAGGSPFETVNVYVLDDDKVVGGCHTQLVWNWLYIEALFYQDREILKTMLNELYSHFKDKSEAIIFESYINDCIEDFKVLGFKVLGILKDKPIGYESHILINKNMTNIPVNHEYNIEVSNKKHEVYSKIIDKQVKEYNEKNKIDEEKIEIEYVAFDNEKLVGGVYGYLSQDYLCISVIWVEEAYRGNDIATKLMDYIEEEAKEKGYNNSYLGTCTFQAQGFYEKRGYNVEMIMSNCPKGYDNYMMVKII